MDTNPTKQRQQFYRDYGKPSFAGPPTKSSAQISVLGDGRGFSASC